MADVVNDGLDYGWLLEPPDWPWRWITGELVSPSEQSVTVELWHRASEAVCRYSQGGARSREESYIDGTLRITDFEAERRIVRIGEPATRAMRKVTEPFLGPLRAVLEGDYTRRPERDQPGATFVNRYRALTLVSLDAEGLPRRIHHSGVRVTYRDVRHGTTEAPASVTDMTDWPVETYTRLGVTDVVGTRLASVAGVPLYEAFAFQGLSMAAPYRTAIWKRDADEIKLVTGTGPGAGPVGEVREPRSWRTRTPNGFAYLFASSPALLEAAADELHGLAGFHRTTPTELDWKLVEDEGGTSHEPRENPHDRADRRERSAGAGDDDSSEG